VTRWAAPIAVIVFFVRASCCARHATCSDTGIIPRSTLRAAIAAAPVVLSACTTLTLGHVPVVSTRPVTAADLARPAALTRTVEGRSCVWVIGAWPVGFPSLGAAVDEAIEAGGARALWDADIRYRIRYVPPLGTACYLARGRAP
jgi:hypothetical protein